MGVSSPGRRGTPETTPGSEGKASHSVCWTEASISQFAKTTVKRTKQC